MASSRHAIKIVKPTTAARRGLSYLTRTEITKNKPEKSLVVPLKKHAGRDRLGHISVRHRGGGAKRRYRLIDFSGLTVLGQPATVKAIEYDPNRSANLALIEYPSGKKSYVLAAKDLAVGAVTVTDRQAAIAVGNRLPLAQIPTGTPIYNLELTPGRGGQLVRSAGTTATILAKEDKYAQVRLPSGEIRMIHLKSLATIGQVSNVAHNTVRIAKAGRRRWMGRRPTVRGKAMNPVDHPHGGGEGNQPIGLRYPKSPTGRLAIGGKTRRNKRGAKFILHRT